MPKMTGAAARHPFVKPTANVLRMMAGVLPGILKTVFTQRFAARRTRVRLRMGPVHLDKVWLICSRANQCVRSGHWMVVGDFILARYPLGGWLSRPMGMETKKVVPLLGVLSAQTRPW